MRSTDRTLAGLHTARRVFANLAEKTADSPGVTRASYGEGEAVAHAMIIAEAKRIGLEHRQDRIGNLYITLPGVNRQAPCVLIGSHLDSVPHGGNFDGAAGAVAGIVVLEELSNTVPPPVDVTVIAIRAEEMIWFPEHYLGSRAAFGLLPVDTANRIRRADTGKTLAEHMRLQGFDPDTIASGHATLEAGDIRCFVELHIEQGPVLVKNELPIGIVTSIRGNKRYRYCSIIGETTHAGGVPRHSRRDALLAGVQLVSELEHRWIELEDAGHDLVLTVGQFTTDSQQHGITKVPGRIDFTLDFRSVDKETLQQFDLFLNERSASIANERAVQIDLGRSTSADPALMDSQLISEFEAAAVDTGVNTMKLASGGGHDSAVFAGQNIPTAMLFIRNRNGSHNPQEAMEFSDFSVAVKVLQRWLNSNLSELVK